MAAILAVLTMSSAVSAITLPFVPIKPDPIGGEGNELPVQEVKNDGWYTWTDSGTGVQGTLKLQGQLPVPSETGFLTTIAENEFDHRGTNDLKITTLTIEPGTVAGTSLRNAFFSMYKEEPSWAAWIPSTIEGLENLDTGNVTDMSGMFWSASSLELLSLDVSSFDMTNVTDVSYMFAGQSGLTTLDISSFTKPIQNDLALFEGDTALKSLTLPAGFAVMPNMHLPNKDQYYAGWAKKGTTQIISGDGEIAVFTATTAGEYVRIPNKVNKVGKPVIKTAFGGRTVVFDVDEENFAMKDDIDIYYNFGSSNITTECPHVKPNEVIFLNEPMTGNKAAMFFKAYKDGKWSAVGKWGVLNVKIAAPLITQSGPKNADTFKIYTQTKDSYIIYTLDGSVPSAEEGTQKLKVTNGRIIWGTTDVVKVPKGRTIKAIAIRNGLVTSDVMTFTNE